jgi:hypothetical protein
MLRSIHSQFDGAGSNTNTRPLGPTSFPASSAKSPLLPPTSTNTPPGRRNVRSASVFSISYRPSARASIMGDSATSR